MTLKTKKIISNIAFYLALVIIYGFAIFAIITKFSGGSIFIGNTRMDVVLTDSMSVKNEHHLDFLEGTTQIQPFDIVVSEKINENTKLEVKDCVLFKNPNLGNKTVVHRIINITENGIEFKVNNFLKEKINDLDAFSFISPTSGSVTLSVLDFTNVNIVSYSYSSTSYISLMVGPNVETVNVQTELIKDGLYKHQTSFSRISSAPNKTSIVSGTDAKEYITDISYTSKSKGTYTFNASELNNEATNNYRKLFGPYYLYEIRADKSSTADGIYEREALISRVHTVVPKLGHVIHFIQSIPGLITLIGLALIITLASFFWTKNAKKKLVEETTSNTSEVVEEVKEVEEEGRLEDKKNE